MFDNDFESGWKQHFPTYKFRKRDVALEEYRTATKSLESDERVFLNASNIALIAAGGLGSLVVGSLDKLLNEFGSVLPISLILIFLLSLILVFSFVTMRYFADRQRAIVFAARKVIVLRRMLGLSYGTVQLVLPNWRIEAADEPFALRLFPGWTTYVAYPYYILASISSAVIFFLLAAIVKHHETLSTFSKFPAWGIITILTVAWAIFLAYSYRTALIDTHERPFLLLIQDISRTIRLRLVTNIEYVIYRAKLARYEIVRLKVDLSNLKKALVFIEDRSFFSHHGVSIRGLLRALVGLVNLRRRAGGSTITQQLVRTLFIQEQTKLFRRKFTEILLALWFDRVFSKNDQLDLYLASVRFERGIYGVLEAMQYFWGCHIATPSIAQSFFLVERVSNIHSRLLTEKIIQTVNAAVKSGLMKTEDQYELLNIYRESIKSGKITDSKNGIERMADAFR